MEKIELGDKVRDRVTGFTGICIGITTWLYGCRRIAIQPQELKDHSVIDAQSFDEPAIEVVEKSVIIPYPEEETKAAAARPGGPHRIADRRQDARK